MAALQRPKCFSEIIPRSPPDSENLHCQTCNHDRGTCVGAWIYVPCPFLCGPDEVNQYRMHSGFPQQERCCPGNVGVELIVQTSRAKHPDHYGGEDGGQYKGRRDKEGRLVFHLRWKWLKECSSQRRQGESRGLGPACHEEQGQERSMSDEQRHGELARQKCFLSYEPPIYCPSKKEPPGYVE